MMASIALSRTDEIYSAEETSADFSNVLKRILGARSDDRTGADIISARDFVPRKRAEKKYPLWNFCVNHTPLSTLVYFEGGHWFAENGWLNVIGDGETPKEAMDDLVLHINHFKDFYAQAPDNALAVYALELKNRYSLLIQV
jgi:hypothetical protein